MQKFEHKNESLTYAMKILHKSIHQPFYCRKKLLKSTNHFYDILIFQKDETKTPFEELLLNLDIKLVQLGEFHKISFN